MKYCDLMEIRGGFREQCLCQSYNNDLNIPTNHFSLLDLKGNSDSVCDLNELVNTVYDEDGTFTQHRKLIDYPVFGCMYSESTCKFTLRKYESGQDVIVNTNYVEFEVANEFTRQPCCNFMLLAKYRNFSDLATYVVAQLRRAGSPLFCNMVKSPDLNGYEHFIEAAQRFFPTTWISYYVDMKLAELYLGSNYSQVINKEVTNFLQMLIKSKKHKSNGQELRPLYVLNTRYFFEHMWDVKIMCPGVLIGYTPGLVMYGDVLSNIMSMEEA